MNPLDAQIIKYVKRVRGRIAEQTVIQFGLLGVIGGFALAIVFACVALFVPWYYAVIYSLGAAGIGILTGVILGMIKRPSMEKAALKLDAHGFQERLVTAYGLVGKEDAVSNLQKQDTVKRLGGFPVRKTFPLRPRWKQLLLAFGLAAVFAGMSFIPTAAKEQAAEQHILQEQIGDEIQKIENAMEQIEGMENLSELEKEDLMAVLEESMQELQNAETSEELEKALERVAVKIDQEAEQAQHQTARQALRTLADTLSPEEKTQAQQLSEALNDIQNDLQKMDETSSAEDWQSLADAMQQLGTEMNNNTIQELGKDMENSAPNQKQIQAAQQAIANAQQSMQNSEQTTSPTGSNNQSGQSSQNNNPNSGNGQSGQTVQTDPNGQNGQSGQPDGNGQSGQSGQNGGNGQGNENGQGNSGEGGSGYNTGSETGTQKPAGQNGQMVTIPDLTVQDNESLEGQLNTNGTGVMQKGGEAWTGTSVDYQQVVGEYSQNAYNKVEGSNYPSGVQDIVKSYFDTLNNE